MIYRKIIRNKKSQIFGMSFEMIFSIFLAAVFLFAAIFAIKHFIDLKNCTEMNKYLSDFQAKVDLIFESEYSKGAYFSEPVSLTAICLVNSSTPKNIGNQQNKDVIDDVWETAGNYHSDFNLFIWPEKAARACKLKSYQKINHVYFEQNPLCFFNSQGKIRINMEKGYNDALVKIVK